MKIVIWVSVIVIVAVLGGVGYFTVLATKPADGSAALTVQLYEVERGELAELVGATGEVEPRRDVQISARVSARIVEIPFDEGEHVLGSEDGHEPSVLLRLDASDIQAKINSSLAHREAQAGQIDVARARLESVRANIQGVEATLADARRVLDRQSQLLASRDVSQSSVDQAQKVVDELVARLASNRHSLQADELNIDVMELNLTATDADITRERGDLEYTIIRSPIDGVVTRLNAEVGEMVVTGTMNNRGTVILEVADLSVMIFVAQIDEADIGRIEVNQKAEVYLQAYPDDLFEGTVEQIALKHDAGGNGSKFFKTRIALDTAGKQIYTGLTGDAQIVTYLHDDTVRVPSQSVVGRRTDELDKGVLDGCDFIDKDKTFTAVVYRFVEGKAVASPVEIGPSDDTHTIILAGVEVGDLVIDGPFDALEGLKHKQAVKDKKVEEAEKEKAEKEKEEKEDVDSDTKNSTPKEPAA